MIQNIAISTLPCDFAAFTMQLNSYTSKCIVILFSSITLSSSILANYYIVLVQLTALICLSLNWSILFYFNLSFFVIYVNEYILYIYCQKATFYEIFKEVMIVREYEFNEPWG